MTPPPSAASRRALVAPDSFKGTIDAPDAAQAIGRGLEQAGFDVDRCPVADGGEGTLAVLLEQLGGQSVEIETHDPLGRALRAPVGFIDDGATAIVETAVASGLGRVDEGERDAEAADTFGTGELVAAAIARGARRVLVTLGGSATTDGGQGAISAIRASGGTFGADLVLLCDVTTPYEQAAAIFGPQKGADERAVARLTERLHHRARSLPRDPRGVAMTGAAGGLAGGLWAAFDGTLVSGAAFVLEAVGFERRLIDSGLVVTGEGRLDRQSLEGKIVGAIAARARAVGRPLHVVAGSCALGADELASAGLASIAIATDVDTLTDAGAAIGARASRKA